MKFLVIQTAFIGDVILATPIVEKLRRFYPDARIDFLLRKGNEGLLEGHPHIHRCWVWNKKKAKYKGLLDISWELRGEKYDWIINCQRFAAAGLLTIFSGSRYTVGFNKSPLSCFFSVSVPHIVGTTGVPVHEVDRNLSLIRHLTDDSFALPRLYPGESALVKVKEIVPPGTPYVCLAPTSVWFTKQYPAFKWVELIGHIPKNFIVFLLGGQSDKSACLQIAEIAKHPNVQTLTGRLNFLESAALMRGALMNYVNDSAPMHLASAVNAPVAAVFCSTVPEFGFTPLSATHHIIQTQESLLCRPCGLHGRRSCPQGHFACANSIQYFQFPIPA